MQVSSGITKPSDGKQEKLDRVLELMEKVELCDMFTGKVMGYQWKEDSNSKRSSQSKEGWKEATDRGAKSADRKLLSNVDSNEAAMYVRVDENGDVYESPLAVRNITRETKASDGKVLPSSKGQTVPTTLSRS